MFGYGTTLTVRRQRRDSDGDWISPPVDTVLPGWHIAPTSSNESASGMRDSSSLRLACYGGPQNPDIHAGDRVALEIDDPGADPSWSVVGPPEQWGNVFLDWSPGNVVYLERVAG